MRSKVIRTIAYLAFLTVILGLCHTDAKAAEVDGRKEQMSDDRHPVGGGYAVTGQIPGVYYLPKLYDATNGLPTSEANCILASRDGYIWIGGYSGIIKYDGVNFERLPVNDGLTSARGMFEDSKGRIWIATNDSGVAVLDGRVHFRFTKKDGLKSDSIRTFAEDKNGNVIIGSTAGLSYVDNSMTLHDIYDKRVNNERILRLVSDKNGTVYGHTGNGDIFIVSTLGIGEFHKSSELNMNVTTILTDPDNPGMLYYGTSGQEIYYGSFGSNASELKKIDTAPASNIHWMDYSCSHLWVTSSQVAGYVDDNDSFIPFESLPIKDSFEMVTSDYQGNMWFASSRYGVMKLVADDFLDMTGAAGLEPEVVNTTCKVEDDLYVGTDNGIHIIDKDYRIRVNHITEYFDGVRVRCIIKDRSNNIWVSTFGNDMGVVRIDADGNITAYTKESGLLSDDVRCAYEADDGSILVGTNGGLSVIRKDEIVKNYGTREGLKNLVILTVSQDDSGRIYAGTDGDGIYVIENNNITRIGVEDGLTSDVIMRLKRDDVHGVMWVITSNSVDYIKDGVITNVTTFPYNNNFDVFTVGEDELWFLSSKGIYATDAESVLDNDITDFKLYERSNGLTSIPISHSYSGIDDDGVIYIAGQTGVSAVKADEMYDFSGKTIVGLRSLYFAGKEIVPDKSGTYMLPAEAGRMQINPAVIDYTMADPMVKIYIDGMEDEGVTIQQSKLTSLEYTRIKYGNYTLHIQALYGNSERIISEKTYRISKRPEFFERLSVQIAMIVLALCAIGIIVWRIMTNTIIRKQYHQIQDARDEAEKANSAKSRFLANMSHEIRTPINTILGMDEMILREDPGLAPKEYYGPVTGYAKNIKYATESLLSLINDLLDISKIESGKMHLVEQEYDTGEMIRGIASMIRGRAEEKKLYFDLDIDRDIPQRLYGDAGKIKQIALNLLTNAVKYTDEGGVRFALKVIDSNEVGVMLQISVKDTGIGVKQEDLDKLFTAYERLDEVKNSNIQGTGLGLDISRQFAEMMGGRLWCESVYGEGSEFLFTYRQKVVLGEPLGVFREETENTANKVYMPQFIAPDADILVVDDNPMNLNVIKGLLKPTKVFVTTASSGEECLKKIEDTDFDVVLLDHMMPGMDGIETVEKIREKHPELPVYALTANSTAGGEEFYVSKGFNGYLTKPIDIVSVEHAIMKHLPENIMLKPTEEDTAEEDLELNDDHKWLYDVKELDTHEGILNSGGATQFVYALKMFYDSIDDNSQAIEECYRNDDLRLATVKVHALKTSARIIGALDLSKDCQAMEDAGNVKDMDYIFTHKDKLLADYRKYKDILATLKTDEKQDDDKEQIDPGELLDAYRALDDYISQMDYDAVEMILMQLREYRLPDEYGELVTSLEKSFMLVDWEKMEELISLWPQK